MNQWGWEEAVVCGPIQVAPHVAQRLLDDDSAYDTICIIYKEYLMKQAPAYEVDPVDGHHKRRVVLHLDTNHTMFTNFTHHFRYSVEGSDFALDAAKRKAASKAGTWLFDVLHKSGSILNLAAQAAATSATPPLVQQQQPPFQLIQEFMAHRAKTEEQMRLLAQTMSVLLDDTKTIKIQNRDILKKLDELAEGQSKSVYESLADAAFARK